MRQTFYNLEGDDKRGIVIHVDDNQTMELQKFLFERGYLWCGGDDGLRDFPMQAVWVYPVTKDMAYLHEGGTAVHTVVEFEKTQGWKLEERLASVVLRTGEIDGHRADSPFGSLLKSISKVWEGAGV